MPPDAQKILGLGRGKLSTDSDGQRIGTLGLKDGAKFTLVGTPEHLRFKEREGPPPLDEWDLAYPTRGRDLGASNALPPALDPRNVRRVEQIIRKREITVGFRGRQRRPELNGQVMNEPRPGKRLLVLDLDYSELKENRHDANSQRLRTRARSWTARCHPWNVRVRA